MYGRDSIIDLISGIGCRGISIVELIDDRVISRNSRVDGSYLLEDTPTYTICRAHTNAATSTMISPGLKTKVSVDDSRYTPVIARHIADTSFRLSRLLP